MYLSTQNTAVAEPVGGTFYPKSIMRLLNPKPCPSSTMVEHVTGGTRQDNAMYIQLDWPWIAEWAYAGIFAVAFRFQTKTIFGFRIKKIRGRSFVFFRKVEK